MRLLFFFCERRIEIFMQARISFLRAMIGAINCINFFFLLSILHSRKIKLFIFRPHRFAFAAAVVFFLLLRKVPVFMLPFTFISH